MTIKSERLSKNIYNARIAIALLILLTITILAYRFQGLRTEYINWVVHTHLEIERFEMLLTDLLNAETGQRGFIITGKDEYLEPYNGALQHISSRVKELRQLTKDNPAQQKRLDSIQTLTDRNLAELALTIRVRQSRGFDAAQTIIGNDLGKAIMDSIRLKVANAQNQEYYLLSERTRAYRIYSHRLNVVLVSGVIAAILILMVIIILLKHENSVRTRVEKELWIQQEHLNDLVEERTSELKASEQRWATTLASLVDAVIATDEIGRITFMNAAAESTTGWSMKEVLHKPLHEIFKIMSGERRQPLEDPFERVLKEKVINDLADHTILVQKDGKEIPIDNSGTRMQSEDGSLMGVVLVFHDSTKRMQTEEALRNQAALLNFAHDAIIVRNAADQITFWNRGAEETYGWAPEEAVGRVTQDLLKIRFPRPLAEINEEAGQTGEWNGELIHTRKDGQEIVVASRWALQRDIWGRHTATLEINRDITDRKKAEEALKHYTEELAAANRDLESFSYSVSHDLRNPLSTIRSFAGLLMEDYSERLDEEGRGYLRHIDNGVNKMKALIDDILNLSRIGRQEMSRTDVDLSAIVRNYLQELKSTEVERQTDIVIQNEVHAFADPRLIHLALENLLRNAWKFTSKKEVTRIEFGTAIKDGQTVYFIRDNGVGFDMQFAVKIFEPFRRLHAEREFGGTGVGLSIVQRVIGRHGGKVWAESEPDKGATFFFTLPA